MAAAAKKPAWRRRRRRGNRGDSGGSGSPGASFVGASSLCCVDVAPNESMRERHLAVYEVQTIDDVTRLRRRRGVTIGGRLGPGVSAWGELLPGGDEAAPRYKLTFLLSRSGGTMGGRGEGEDTATAATAATTITVTTTTTTTTTTTKYFYVHHKVMIVAG